MMQSENTAELSAALCKAQSTMRAATFNKVNPHFKNKYADLASVLEAIRKPLADNGLSITQTTEVRCGQFVLITTLRHSTGQWVSGEYLLPMQATPQQMGSALTYARRYSLSSIACIAADEDDDAEGARKNGLAVTDERLLLSDKQLTELNEFTVKVGANLDAFCKHLGIGTLDELPATRFSEAWAALEEKEKWKAKAGKTSKSKLADSLVT